MKSLFVNNAFQYFAFNQKEGKCLIPQIEIRNEVSGNRTEILVYDILVNSKYWEDDPGVTLTEIVDAVKDISSDEIDLRINSAGGVSAVAVAARQWLREHPATINVKVDGLAASAAATLVTAADSPKNVGMARGSQIMIHPPWTFAMGDENEMEAARNMLRSAHSGIADIYAHHTGVDAKKIDKLMRAETWYNAQEAIDFGFAGYMQDDVEVENKLTLPQNKFKNTPKNIKQVPLDEYEQLFESAEAEEFDMDFALYVEENP